MTLATLSFDQAPPIGVPFRFFLTAPLFLLLAALAWLCSDSAALATRWSPALLGITHLLTLGFMGMVMCGAMLQLLPVLAGAPVPNPRLLAWTIHLPLTAGSLLLAGAFYFSLGNLLLPAMLVLLFALGSFLLVALLSLARAPARNASTRAMQLALLALGLTLTLALLLILTLSGWLQLPLLRLTALHVAWGLLGWTLLLLIGVAYQVVPMFQLTPPYPPRATRWLATSLFGALLLWSAASLGTDSPAWQHWAALPVLACAGVFAVLTLSLQRRRKRRVADITLQFWQLAMASLLGALALWLVARMSTALAHSEDYPLALGVLLIVGLALSAIMGMLYKIAPFLIWFHLQAAAPGRRVPHMKEIIQEGEARGHWHSHWLGLGLLLIALLWRGPWLYAAGFVMAINAALLTHNLLRAWLRYRTALTRAG